MWEFQWTGSFKDLISPCQSWPICVCFYSWSTYCPVLHATSGLHSPEVWCTWDPRRAAHRKKPLVLTWGLCFFVLVSDCFLVFSSLRMRRLRSSALTDTSKYTTCCSATCPTRDTRCSSRNVGRLPAPSETLCGESPASKREKLPTFSVIWTASPLVSAKFHCITHLQSTSVLLQLLKAIQSSTGNHRYRFPSSAFFLTSFLLISLLQLLQSLLATHMQDVSTDLLWPFCQLVDECYSCLHEGNPVSAWLGKAWWEEGAMYPHIPTITQAILQLNPISSKPPADLGSPLLTVSLRQPKSMWFCGSRKGALFLSSAGCRDNRWVTPRGAAYEIPPCPSQYLTFLCAQC